MTFFTDFCSAQPALASARVTRNPAKDLSDILTIRTPSLMIAMSLFTLDIAISA